MHTLQAVIARSPAETQIDRVCASVAELLGIDGASMAASYSPTMSVPIGASDDVASAAERAQFTAGEGPCMYVQNTGALSLIADLGKDQDAGRVRWPTYSVLLARVSDYRCVLAVPVPPPTPSGARRRLAGAAWGVPVALTCYRRQPLYTEESTVAHAASAVGAALSAALSVSAAMGAVLGGADAFLGSESSPRAGSAAGAVPAWLDSPAALTRAVVWQAEEVLLLADEGLDREGALAALRTYAVIHALTVDEAADGLVRGRLRVEDVRGQR